MFKLEQEGDLCRASEMRMLRPLKCRTLYCIDLGGGGGGGVVRRKMLVCILAVHVQLFFFRMFHLNLIEFVDMECVKLESRLPPMRLLLSA